MIGPDKEVKILKESRLMEVSEFHQMVLSLQRFKEDFAVKALTGKKNIRRQQTPDKVFFSVLEKMLLEVSSSCSDISIRGTEHQLLSLRKVYLWFQSNKHVLVKSDGYFRSARKITEEIYEKKSRPHSIRTLKNRQHSKQLLRDSPLKTIEFHLDKLHDAEMELESRHIPSVTTSMFAASSTQELTSIESALPSDDSNNLQDLSFARGVYDDEYGNTMERLNRPMTAPPKTKQPIALSTSPTINNKKSVGSSHFPAASYSNKGAVRPQSAIAQVKHELSWAKHSPTPLSVLIRRNAEAHQSHKNVAEEKTKIEVTIPLEEVQQTDQTATSLEEITDPVRISNLVMFKEFCLEHATQQENYLQQYVRHIHGTRQHFLEFPENKTEDVVRKTAKSLYTRDKKSAATLSSKSMDAYKGMSLVDFLDLDAKSQATVDKPTSSEYVKDRSGTASSAPARLVMSRRHDNDAISALNSSAKHSSELIKVPRPPQSNPHRVTQPSNQAVTITSVYDLASSTGKRMNAAKEQALSAPKHGWRYPMASITYDSEPEDLKKGASGVVLALQENDVVQHKVLIPLASSPDNSINKKPEDIQADSTNQANLPLIADPGDARPNSAYSFTTGSGFQSRCSNRPASSPRYVTEANHIAQERERIDLNNVTECNYAYVRTVYGQRKLESDLFNEMRRSAELSEFSRQRRSLRSAGTSVPVSRPRTAASWATYPSKSEVSRSTGAASHHSTGIMRHRSVAETMRVKSVEKQRYRANSGRSSASSYVAQLREKKRAGASGFIQPKSGHRRRIDPESLSMFESPPQQPHLSFLSITAPIYVPSNLTASAYARPAGVYCGTTAAVAIATENPAKILDYAPSDSELSYEDYPMESNEEASEHNQMDTENQNWLSQWLSGGPLDGLHDSAGQGGGPATYADLVSRAAILDSSDERSYSSHEPADMDFISPRVEFSLSPRSDPLISHRSTDTEDKTQDSVTLNLYEKHETAHENIGQAQPESLRSSGDFSGNEQKEDFDDSVESHVDSKVDGNEEEDNMEEKVEEKEEESIASKTEDSEQDISSKDEDRCLDLDENSENENCISDQDDADNDKVGTNNNKPIDNTVSDSQSDSSDVTLKQEEVSDNNNDFVDVVTQPEEVCRQTDSSDVAAKSEKVVSHEISISNMPKNSDFTNNQTISESENILPKNDDSNLGDASEEGAIVSQSSELNEDVCQDENTAEDKSELESVDQNEEPTDERLDNQSATEGSASSDSYTESESDIVNDNCPVRIVVTSARKVERELMKKKMYSQQNRDALALLRDKDEHSSEQSLPSNEETKPSEADALASTETQQPVLDGIRQETESEMPEQTCTETAEQVPKEAASSEEQVNQSDVQQRASVASTTTSNMAEDKTAHIITFEEVSAVTSLSRPSSGRPIPSESEVKDPFVDLVASTRQRQIERGVDVQTIFRGTVPGDAYKKFDPEERRIREEEQRAVVMMQRAYRRHLARTRAARKCSGMNKETLEWARSYKALLVEKREARERRLRNSRSSSRSMQRRNSKRMSRIGPHTDVYEIYHPEPVLPDIELVQESAVEIQRYVRGWLVRLKLERVKALVVKCDCSLSAAVKEYRDLLRRTQQRHGRLKPSLFLTFEELEDYLHQRAKYDLIFKKRQFWNEVESSDLPAFFSDCGLFPSQDEISEAWDAVSKSMDSTQKKTKKHSATALSRDDVLEVAFHIYVPSGARMEDLKTRSLTWMTPIHDGEEGLKLMMADDECSEVESADLELVGRLVAESIKARKKEGE